MSDAVDPVADASLLHVTHTVVMAADDVRVILLQQRLHSLYHGRNIPMLTHRVYRIVASDDNIVCGGAAQCILKPGLLQCIHRNVWEVPLALAATAGVGRSVHYNQV
jgi:uncharacterized protein (UPF0248 family)